METFGNKKSQVNRRYMRKMLMRIMFSKRHIYFFRTNFNTNTIKLTHYFPEKYLEGYYEAENTILRPGVTTIGKFNLTLCKNLCD